ncbi:MAG: DUF4259 domain-containing protein [Terracidiphilus sp.]|jgi:hypothetical protein
MGCWGTGVFENDCAADFVYDVVNGTTLFPIETAIDRVLQVKQGYIEAPVAEEAMAAAAILVRLKDKTAQVGKATQALNEWIGRTKLSPSADLFDKARHSVERVLTEPSELLELWGESDEFDNWKSSAENLAARL